eukprot:11208267-Lingulodinium_polyedra.AAC.1
MLTKVLAGMQARMRADCRFGAPRAQGGFRAACRAGGTRRGPVGAGSAEVRPPATFLRHPAQDGADHRLVQQVE